jgi:hypothetical protein
MHFFLSSHVGADWRILLIPPLQQLASPMPDAPSSEADLSPSVSYRSNDPLPQLKPGKGKSSTWRIKEMEVTHIPPLGDYFSYHTRR